jgi:hypothetical protein
VTINVSESIVVARPPIDVFDFTQDYDRRPEWDTYVTAAEIVSYAPRRVIVRVAAVGRYTVEYRLFRRGERTSAQFVDVESRWLAGGGGSWRYEPVAEGTRWTQTNTFELKHPRLLRWAAPLVRMLLRRSMRQAMREARRLMDAGARGKPAVDPGADTPLVTSVEFADRAQELMPQSS